MNDLKGGEDRKFTHKKASVNVIKREWVGNKLAVPEINDDERISGIFSPLTLVVIIHIIFNVIINFERENLMALFTPFDLVSLGDFTNHK